MARPICLVFDRQEVWRAFSRACAKTGKRIAARMAMMAMTTSSSISVNARRSRRMVGSFPSRTARMLAVCSLTDPLFPRGPDYKRREPGEGRRAQSHTSLEGSLLNSRIQHRLPLGRVAVAHRIPPIPLGMPIAEDDDVPKLVPCHSAELVVPESKLLGGADILPKVAPGPAILT